MSALRDAPFYRYHELSKHSYGKLLKSEHEMDWDNQPNPFRVYSGAPRVVLPPPGPGDWPLPHPADRPLLSSLLYYSLAISAWKHIPGTHHTWSLRVNPSSGNLHPTETHLLVRAVDGLAAGAYHYAVRDHALEQRAQGGHAARLWAVLGADAEAPCPPLLVFMTTIFWRESWKYRERAFRYCHHDLGHALCAVLLSAHALGWRVRVRGEFPDQEVAQLLGLAGGDEQPALVLALRPAGEIARFGGADDPPGPFLGTPNPLSSSQVPYPAIDAVHGATCLGRAAFVERQGRIRPPPRVVEPPELPLPGILHVVRARRSAIDFDGRQRMPRAHLEALLALTAWAPHADFQAQPLIRLFLYLHRVEDLEPGIYAYDRQGRTLARLLASDQRGAARYLSCFQDIAADGCFAVSMIADLAQAWARYGDRGYRYLHYEAGFVGQCLYVGATALGYDATGIGCFLDDDINHHLALPEGHEVVYNFTVGKAKPDPRLTTLPSYPFF